MQKSSLRRPFNIYPSSFYETVTFNSRQSANQSAFDSYTIFRAKRRKITDEEKLARGLLNVTVLAWLVDQSGLDNAGPGTAVSPGVTAGGPGGAPDPKPGDQIIDASGSRWIITDGGVEIKQLGNVYECVCQLSVS